MLRIERLARETKPIVSGKEDSLILCGCRSCSEIGLECVSVCTAILCWCLRRALRVASSAVSLNQRAVLVIQKGELPDAACRTL